LDECDLSGSRLNNVSGFCASFNNAKLRWTKLNGANLVMANFKGADLEFAEFNEANLSDANLNNTNLSRAKLEDANLKGAKLEDANLSKASLRGAGLRNTNLSRAKLSGADLSYSTLVETEVNEAIISESRIYGISVWDLIGEFKSQQELIVTPDKDSIITVDDIKIAQFIYLVLNNEEIRNVINTLTSKAVLILGRFSIPERKAILDALRNKLREYDLLPIVFDFDRPIDKDFTETIKTLAGISYFVIADVTNPKSSPLELQATVPDYQIPFVPIIQEGEEPFSMMADLHQKYNWVLPTKSYDSIETLIAALKLGIIDPAVELRNKLRLIKAQEHTTESLRDYLDKSL